MTKKTPYINLLFCTASLFIIGTANASCPIDMPMQLLQDCITVESSGTLFPNEGYAYTTEYEEWLKTRENINKTASSSTEE